MQITKIKKLCFSTAVLAICSSSVLVSNAFAADQLFLKNGDKISGDIIEGQNNAAFVRFQTHYGATMTIPNADIQEIKTEGGDVLQYNADPVANATSVAEVASTEPAAGTEEIKDPTEYKWSGRINLGASLDDGNSQKKAVTGDAEITARNEKNRWIAGANANFANDEGVETENDQSLYGEYNYFLSDKWFLGARQEFEIDKIAQLDLRSTTGLFAGYQFYEQEDLNLRVRFGPSYIYEDFESGDREEDIAFGWALNYDQTFWDDSLTIFHNHELDTPFDPASAFIFQSETGIRVPVGNHLVGTAQVDFDWDNEPAAGIREEDTSYSVKLGYEW